MSNLKDGGPAFPVAEQGLHGTYGMSLRDWFAGQALTGLLSQFSPEVAPRMAYQIADAMLAARNKE